MRGHFMSSMSSITNLGYKILDVVRANTKVKEKMIISLEAQKQLLQEQISVQKETNALLQQLLNNNRSTNWLKR